MLIGDQEKTPQQLEADFLAECLKADCVYVCDIDGYIGNAVTGELFFFFFFFAAEGQEVYFYACPQDPLLDSVIGDTNLIYSPEELVLMMLIHNKFF